MTEQSLENFAALLYRDHDPLDFEAVADMLSLVLEPEAQKFRVIHQKGTALAVISSADYHAIVSLHAKPFSNPAFRNAYATQLSLKSDIVLLDKVVEHQRSVCVMVGDGRLPKKALNDAAPLPEGLKPIITRTVVQHLENMNPSDAIFWGASSQILSASALMRDLNGPVNLDGPEKPDTTDTPAPPKWLEETMVFDGKHARPTLALDKTTDIEAQRRSLFNARLSTPRNEPKGGPLGFLHSRLTAAIQGPKAVYGLSALMFFFAPLIALFLFLHNFMSGARLRRTAFIFCIFAVLNTVANYLGTEPLQSAGIAALATLEPPF